MTDTVAKQMYEVGNKATIIIGRETIQGQLEQLNCGDKVPFAIVGDTRYDIKDIKGGEILSENEDIRLLAYNE